MPGQKKKYDYNIIHDENDAKFAYNLERELVKVNPHWKGFYSDKRLPGSLNLTAAQNEIKDSKVNVCLTRPSIDKVVKHIQDCAVQAAIDNGTLPQLIFVAHGGDTKENVIERYGLNKTCKVVEFMVPQDPEGLQELTEELTSLLEKTKPEGHTKHKEEKSPVEETGEPGQYTGAYGHNFLVQRQYPVQGPHAGQGNKASRKPLTPEQAFQDVLVEVAKELTEANTEVLKFLLAPSPRDSKLLKTNLEVLDFLTKTHDLSYNKSHILIDMLEILDRVDLAGMVRRYSSIPVGGQGVSPYRRMLFNITELLDQEDIKRLKTILVKQYKFRQKPINDCKTGLELVTLLRTDDSISESDSHKTKSFLKELTSYLDKATKSSAHSFIDEWQKLQYQDQHSLDGPSPATVKDRGEVLDEMKQKCPNLAELWESYLKCNIEMFQDLDYEKMGSYYDSSQNALDEGGFGKVYQGVKKLNDVAVVVKVSKDYKEKTKRQFFREKSFAIVKHFALLPILAVCDWPKTAWIIMYPWMKNGDLRKLLSAEYHRKKLDWKKCIRILTQIAEALDFLHTTVCGVRQPIRHGDVKPSNILLDADFSAKLGDAGLADELEAYRAHITATRVEGTDFYYDKHTFNEATNKYEKRLTNDVYAFGWMQMVSGVSEHTLYYKKDDWSKQAMEDTLPLSDWFKGQDLWAVWAGERLSQLVKHCINGKVEERKEMKEVVQELRNIQEKSKSAVALTSRAKCVQCLVNDTAKALPCKCKCTFFCQSCLKRAYANPLTCPNHGPTEPPIGHSKVYAILVAASSGKDKNIFNIDVKNMYRTITDPKIMGVRESNVYHLVEEEDKKQKSKATQQNLWKVLDRVKSKSDDESTIIFYITCHADKDNFELGDDQLVPRKEVVRRLSAMTFGTLLLICDCCCAADNTSVNVEKIEDKNVYQLYSCCSAQKSFSSDSESVFTSYILDGLNSVTDQGCPEITASWMYNQYIDVGNLAKYVDKRMERFRSDKKEQQKPLLHSVYSSTLRLAFYNRPEQLHQNLVFQGLEGQQMCIKLRRRPRHYPDLNVLKKEVWAEIGKGYANLDENYLQIVKEILSHGELHYQELNDPKDLQYVLEEKLKCRFRQDYVFYERPLVHPIRDDAEKTAWHRCLRSTGLEAFVTVTSNEEYSLRLSASGQKFVDTVKSCLQQEQSRTVKDCLQVLDNVFCQSPKEDVVKVTLYPHFITLK